MKIVYIIPFCKVVVGELNLRKYLSNLLGRFFKQKKMFFFFLESRLKMALHKK